MEKVKYLKIDKPEGRRFAISDIHGCANTFKALVKQLKLKKRDHLYILGDTINRGPKSAEVLDFIIKLKRKGRNVFLLKGNHEDLIIKSNQKGPDYLLKLLGSGQSEGLANGGRIKDPYLLLFQEMYHYFELDQFYLVHAGFDFSLEKPFEDSRSMMYIKEFKPKKKMLDDKKVILGHSPRSIDEIVERLKAEKRKIYIDNGCINKKNKGQGSLIALNLDSLSIHLQINID